VCMLEFVLVVGMEYVCCVGVFAGVLATALHASQAMKVVWGGREGL